MGHTYGGDQSEEEVFALGGSIRWLLNPVVGEPRVRGFGVSPQTYCIKTGICSAFPRRREHQVSLTSVVGYDRLCSRYFATSHRCEFLRRETGLIS